MDFSSDTSAAAHPSVIEAITSASEGRAPSYGGDDWTLSVEETLTELFETDISALIVSSGTAANALALSILCPPTSAILCHEAAHIAVDERGAPEFYTGGGKLHLLPGRHGKIAPEALDAALKRNNRDFVHETPADVLSLTNLTENGTAYSVAEITTLCTRARNHGLRIHLDGARLANALVSLGASPGEMTWRAGVDVLTLGLTKTGAMGCEIIVLFGDMRDRIGELRARAKRAGHLPPKARFLAAQAAALFDQALWLDLASRANQSARRLADVLGAAKGVTIAAPVHGNEVFANLPEETAARLTEAGAQFYPWPDGTYRFVCAWSTTDRDIDAVKAALAG